MLPDALSRLYEFDSLGTIRALSEYVQHDPTVNPEGTSLCQILTAPLLVGPEAMACTPDVNLPTLDDDWELIHHEEVLPPPKPRARKPPPPPAETGQPETGAEFAKQMCDHFVLLGPGERKKGGKEPQETVKENVNQTEVDLTRDDQPLPKLPEDVARKIPVTYPHDEDLLYKAKGRYIEDPMFQKILDSPRAYKNFIVSKDGMICLRLYNRTVLCVPNIRVDGRRLQEMIVDQAHSLLAHLGAHKTLSYL